MMLIEVQFEGLIANVVGKKQTEVDLPEGASARNLITQLARQYDSSLEYLLLTPRGELRPWVIILVQGNDIAQCGGLDTSFGDQARVVISVTVRPITGGA